MSVNENDGRTTAFVAVMEADPVDYHVLRRRRAVLSFQHGCRNISVRLQHYGETAHACRCSQRQNNIESLQ